MHVQLVLCILISSDYNIWLSHKTIKDKAASFFFSSSSSPNSTIPSITLSKMFSASQDHSQNLIQIKQDDKFFLRLLSKESSMANPSLRVYYGEGAGAVPFMWESRPGTPKCSFNETTLPPLTPPPSSYFNSDKNPNNKKYTRSNLLHILFPKMNMLKKSDRGPSSPSSSSSSSNSSRSSSNFSMVVPITSPKKYHHHARSRFSSRGSSFDSRADYEDAEVIGSSPTSTLWFRRIKGCYGW